MVDMRDLGNDTAKAVAAAGVAVLTAPSLGEIETFIQRLGVEATGLDDAERIDRIDALETLRGAAEAAQTETVADLVVSHREAATARRASSTRRSQGLAVQVGLARRTSPHRAQRDVELAMVLRTELPHTRAAYRAGRIDAYRTAVIARETACLSAEDRAIIDEQLCGRADALEEVERLTPRRLAGRIQRAAAELDPASMAERRRRAEADRHTTLRPAPDVMSWFGALLPVKDGVAVHATLDREARSAKAAGDQRSIGQLMADILVQRVLHPEATRSAAAGATPTSTVPVMVNLIVRDDVLLGDRDGAGWIDGHGPVPGDLIRQWIADNLDSGVTTWLRRVYEQPDTGQLVAMDSRATFFDGALAAFLRIRDRVCRTVGCGTRIRHSDHITPRSRGGPTSADNGQGTCELCNYAKEADGWSHRVVPGDRHTVEITTPTGHVYRSTAERF